MVTNEVRTERVKDEYRFSIQVGRRVQDWTFRGGLIESSGGIGVDWDKSDWGSRFTMDVFDYRDDIGVNLRVRYEQQLWNVLYGRVDGDDLLEDNRSATFSAGLRFNDEDLKVFWDSFCRKKWKKIG